MNRTAKAHVKVLAVTRYLSNRGGGIPPAMLKLYELLGSKGVDVVLVAADRPDCATGTRVVVHKVLGPRALSFSPDLLAIINSECPDIVHLHGLWSYGSIAVQLWSRRTGKPVVVSPHGMADSWALRQRSIKKRLAATAYEWGNLRKAKCIHALSEGEVESLHRLGFIETVVRIPNGVELPVMPQKRSKSRENKTILYLGRLHPKKGIAEILIGWANLQRNCGDVLDRWRLVIAGWDDGGHQIELVNIARKYEIESFVDFVGPVFGSDKAALYANAEAVILASHSEGLPMTILEAWSFGKPVFMTEFCNLPEGFRAGAAFKIAPDPRNIAEVLGTVLPDEARMASAGRAGRALVESSFSWNQVTDAWLSVYSSLLQSSITTVASGTAVR